MKENQNEERIVKLEMLAAEQENLISSLNDILVKQQFTIDKLDQQIKLLAKIVKQGDSNIAKEAEESPPPHY